MKIKQSTLLKDVVAGGLIAAVVIGCVFCVVSFRTHRNLLGTWGFARQTRREIAPGLYLYRTSGSDVMLGDVNGVGLIDGNIVKYAAKGTEVFFAVKTERAGQIQYFSFGSDGRGVTSLGTNAFDGIVWETP